MRHACTAVALLIAPLAFAESTGDVRDVRVVRSADQEARAAALGQPSIARWRETHLAAAYSGDGGGTWSVAHEEPDLWNTVSEAWFGQSQLGTQLYI
jgi:hypothetical protein